MGGKLKFHYVFAGINITIVLVICLVYTLSHFNIVYRIPYTNIRNVFTYIYIYIYMYVCMNVWMYECMNVWMYECMNVWMYECMYVCMYVCMYIIVIITIKRVAIIIMIIVKIIYIYMNKLQIYTHIAIHSYFNITTGYYRITTRQGAGFAASGHRPVGCCVWLRGASCSIYFAAGNPQCLALTYYLVVHPT